MQIIMAMVSRYSVLGYANLQLSLVVLSISLGIINLDARSHHAIFLSFVLMRSTLASFGTSKLFYCSKDLVTCDRLYVFVYSLFLSIVTKTISCRNINTV